VSRTDQSSKTHTPQQSVSRPTNVLLTTHNVTVSLSRDNVSITTRKYAHSQRFCHAISAAGLQSKCHRLKRCARQRPVTPAHLSDLALKGVSWGYTGIRCTQTAMDVTLAGCSATRSRRPACSFQTEQCRTQAKYVLFTMLVLDIIFVRLLVWFGTNQFRPAEHVQ